MSLVNTWVYTETRVKGDELLSAFGNKFRVISSRPYVDKKRLLSDGFTLFVLELSKGDTSMSTGTKPFGNAPGSIPVFLNIVMLACRISSRKLSPISSIRCRSVSADGSARAIPSDSL